ncbi:DUF2277 family protein [Arsenicicoccus sp. oral taxon 190]|uniref:DUF2277 family protein n=1 Tax=Arsenicicoccus sp. oral taxon 190 TaxID=1658671 RepID=UPI00067ADE11|nr:DUF2277 family protein [Arsenicicoccus sp. oral taxon 190]
MAKQLRALHDVEMMSTSAEARAAALHYVRRVTGGAGPQPQHREVFEETVLEIAVATQRLIDQLSSDAQGAGGGSSRGTGLGHDEAAAG